MKKRLLVLLLGLVTTVSFSLGSKPTLTLEVQSRLLNKGMGINDQLAENSTGPQRVFVTIEGQEILAYTSTTGKLLKAVTLPKESNSELEFSIGGIFFSSQGQVLAIVNRLLKGQANGGVIAAAPSAYLVNLTKGKITDLGPGLHQAYERESQIIGGRKLIPIKIGSASLAIFDIDSEKVWIRTQNAKIVDGNHFLRANSKGDPVVLAIRHRSIALWEILPGKIHSFLRPDFTSTHWPEYLKLEDGRELIYVTDKEKTYAYDIRSFLDAQITLFAVFSAEDEVIVLNGATFLLKKQGSQVTLINIISGIPLGPPIPVTGRVRVLYHQPKVYLADDNGFEVRSDEGRKRGSIFIYDVESGQRLRELRYPEAEKEEWIPLAASTVAFVQKDNFWSLGKVASGGVFASGQLLEGEQFAVGPFVMQAKGRLLGITKQEDRICLRDLRESNERACVREPLLSSLSILKVTGVQSRNGLVTLQVLSPNGANIMSPFGYTRQATLVLRFGI